MLEKLHYLRAEATQLNIPILSYEKAKWLEEFVLRVKPLSVLELGTAIGFSTILFGQTGAKIITIDRDLRAQERAKEYCEFFGTHVQFEFGDGMEVVQKIPKSKKFDIIFIDFEKKKYLEAFQLLQNRATYILIDNITNPKCQDCYEFCQQFSHELIEGDLMVITKK